MDQKQRIMSVAAGVVLVVALVLIVRAFMGGGDAPEPIPSEAASAFQEAVESGVFKEPPPPTEPEVIREQGSGKRGVAPTDE